MRICNDHSILSFCSAFLAQPASRSSQGDF